MQVLDFTYPPGSNNIWPSKWATQANTSLDLKDFPSTLSICSSIFPKGWVAGMDYKFIGFFTLLNQDGTLSWVSFYVAADPTQTRSYAVIRIGGEIYRITNTINASERLPIYHNSWIRACITLDTATGVVKIVVDGKVLEDDLHPKLRNLEIPRHSIIRVGKRTGIHAMFSDLNVFSELLSIENADRLPT